MMDSNTGDLALTFLRRSTVDASPHSLASLADVAASVVGAQCGRLFVVDYALRRLCHLRRDGSVGEDFDLDGTMAGRAFATGERVAQGDHPMSIWVPLAEGSERIGLLELVFDDQPIVLDDSFGDLVQVLVLMLVSSRRYTDVMLRARRAQPLTEAAEAQWDLLPPLSHLTQDVAVSGILEPAYSIGGDSFDYAINPDRLDFAILDAAGHGLPSVLMSAAAINSLRNARRERRTLDGAYRQADQRIANQFGDSYYVTGQIGTLDLHNGELTWLNAGHVPPLLVRNGSYVGELVCPPSMPIGLGGDVRHIAVEPLQRGDRVLFYTDGVTESRSSDGTQFGVDRLADFLVRATNDRVSAAETSRRLSANVVAHAGAGLRDDATLFLIEYQPGVIERAS